MLHSRSSVPSIASCTLALCFVAASVHAQESTTSFAGPPPAVDENAVPSGVGFNQQGGELSAVALEQAAIGNPTVHYHYYGAPTPASASAPGADATQSAPATTTPPGYAPSTFVAPMTNMPTTSWHLYTGNIGQGVRGGALGGSTNFHIPANGMSGYIPSPDNVAYGSGAFVGDWDPYANGGAGTVQGFD